jgi:hypothetical protein
VSDQGRPQFLPPEEPAEEPAGDPLEQREPRPLLPGMPGMPGPDDPNADGRGQPAPVPRWRLPASRRDRVALSVIALSVAGMLVLGGLLFLRSGTTAPSLASGGRPARPNVPAGSDYASLPDPCAAVGPALPQDVRSVRPLRTGNSCGWRLLRTDRSRSLDVDLQLEETDPALGTSGTVEAARDFADDLAYAADGGRNGGFERAPERLDGLGDEAFAAFASNLVVWGRTERSARSYDMGGAQVEVRRRNIVITVKWRGADYPPAVRGRKRLAGTRLAYRDARRQAVVVADALLRALR